MLSIKAIQKIVLDQYGKTERQFFARTRKREIVEMRQVSIYLCYWHGHPHKDYISKENGLKRGFDHAERAIIQRMETEPLFNEKIRDLQLIINRTDIVGKESRVVISDFIVKLDRGIVDYENLDNFISALKYFDF